MSAQCNLYFKRPAALLAILMPPAAMRSIGSNQVEQLSIAGDSSRVPVPETMCDRRLDTPCMQEPCNIADRATPDDAVASRMYLCYFMHRLLDFRQPEVKALASIAGCHAQTNSDTFGFEKPFGDSKLSPFWYLRLPSEHVAVSILQRSLLVKSFIEVWGEGTTWEEVEKAVQKFPAHLKQPWSTPQTSFKLVVDGWGKVIKHQQQLQIMEKFNFLGFRGPIKLQDPDVTFRIIVADSSDNNGLPSEVPKRIYFGREVANPDRSIIHKFGLPRRKYLGPTSMDTEMAFLICTQAQVQRGHLVYDPFVGTGSILVAAAYYGAYTLGADIDIRVVRDGKVNKSGEAVDIWTNFREYKLQPPAGLIRADAHRPPFRPDLKEFLDAIVADPPYGVRAGGKKGVAKAHLVKDSETHIPSTDPYGLEECLNDLLHMAAKYLKVGRRAVFFLPSAPGVNKAAEMTAHPMLELLENSEQPLTTRYSRRLITLKKVAPYDASAEQMFRCQQESSRLRQNSIHEIVYRAKAENIAAQTGSNIQRFRGKLV